MRLLLSFLCVSFIFGSTAISPAAEPAPTAIDGWTTASPRDEIRPEFFVAGKDPLRLGIKADARKGLLGYWTKSFPVKGGEYVRFEAFYSSKNLKSPRRNAVVKLHWRDAAGNKVPQDADVLTSELPNYRAYAEAEHPRDHGPQPDGRTEVSDVYRAPGLATQLIVELHLQWASDAEIIWSDVSVQPTVAPPSRKVKLAAVHFTPKGPTPADNNRQYDPLVKQAKELGADLIVLGETINLVATGKKAAEVAEPIPGPISEHFTQLSKQYDTHIVVGLFEKDGPLIYNTSILCGPDGQIIGKYRKVTLPREEISDGVTPGEDYPVFDTRFGQVGMMICYDGFYPEVARELSQNGAEVIAWPVWGCNPLLAAARACENQVYLVSSTFTEVGSNWTRTAIYDHAGHILSGGQNWGDIAIAEVDLSRPTRWPSLGDFRSGISRHKPVTVPEGKQDN
ncbi:MAG: carbon-nitrogen hydrolase family protein [Planctomycetaceae bacterium]